MKTEFLKELGIAEDVISKIMAENGKDIEREKSKITTANEQITNLTEQLTIAKTTLEKFKDVNVEELKGKIETLTNDLNTKDSDYQAKISKMELEGKANEFLASKKFVNDFTKDSIKNKLLEALEKDESEGKSCDDILNSFTKDEKGEDLPNIFQTEEIKKDPTGLEHGGSNDNNLFDFNFTPIHEMPTK